MNKSTKLFLVIFSFSASIAKAGNIKCEGSIRNLLSVEVTAFSSAYSVQNPEVKVEGEIVYAEKLPEVGTPDAQFAKKVLLTDKWHTKKFLGLRIAFPEAGADVAIFESDSVKLIKDKNNEFVIAAEYKGTLKVRTNPEVEEMMTFKNAVCKADFGI